jgi:hypothetical protein
MRGQRSPVIWASGTMLAVVLLAAVGLVVAANGLGVPHPSATSTPVAGALVVAEPARPVLAPPDWVGATPMVASAPVRLQIPAIGVDSELMALGLNDDGTMEVPPTGFPAGWYTGAPTPGELGPAVIAGHVDWTGPGVFHDLHLLAVEDEVVVTRADGSTATFGVTRVEQYPKAAFPTDEVYGDIDHAGLRLITCGGVFNRETGSHDDNIVVFAELR